MSASDSAAAKDFTLHDVCSPCPVSSYVDVDRLQASDIIGHALKKLLTKSLQSSSVDIISKGTLVKY